MLEKLTATQDRYVPEMLEKLTAIQDKYSREN